MSVNTKIKHLMKQQGITQNVLADKLGITQAALSNMLSGDNQIRRRTLDKIASALGKTAEVFLDDTVVEELSGRVEQLEKTLRPFKMPVSTEYNRVSFNRAHDCKELSNTKYNRKPEKDNSYGNDLGCGSDDMTGFFYTLLQKALNRIDRLEKEVSELKSKKKK